MPADRILVVDDEETIREIVCSMLTTAGYKCRQAASGMEALALLESGEEFELMLSDLMMANLDGIGLLERTKERFPEMPVVMVTAVHDISVALAAIRNGAYDYLLKPFEREQLLATVRRALENRRLKLENRAYQTGLESLVEARTEQLEKPWSIWNAPTTSLWKRWATPWTRKTPRPKATPSALPHLPSPSPAPWDCRKIRLRSSRAARFCTTSAKWRFLTPSCASPAN